MNTASGCFDPWVMATFGDHILDKLGYAKLVYTLIAACWGANCVTLEAVSKLTADSYCLRYIPEAIRQRFIRIIADVSSRHAERQAYLQSK
jgi:hypothetical protein